MKQLTCEMCSSNDIIKQDGMYVCQSCGTKYSVEDAKKMMVEGTVDVSGSTVKVDSSSSVESFLKISENAYEAGNLDEAETYCNKILEIEPNNHKAWFLKSKVAGWQSTLANVRINEALTCYSNATNESSTAKGGEKITMMKEFAIELRKICFALLHMACNHFEELPIESNEKTVNMVLKHCIDLLQLISLNGAEYVKEFQEDIATRLSNCAISAWNNVVLADYHEDSHPSKYDYERFCNRYSSCTNILSFAVNWTEEKDKKIRIYNNLISFKQEYIKACSYDYWEGGYHVSLCLTDQAKESNIDDIMTYHNKIHELDPSYVVPERPSRPGHSGCYVATAVYGSYDCPQVWTLRRYRDYTLAETWYGRAFIKTYYAISPTLVKLFGKTDWFKKMWKGKLDRMVKNLQENGVESTPYNDREW